jgi:hypothetical protein
MRRPIESLARNALQGHMAKTVPKLVTGKDSLRRQEQRLAFDVSAVNPAEFSEVCRPD